MSGSVQASCSLTYGPPGAHAITASYSGDALFQASTSGTATTTVGAASSATTVSGPSTSVVGQPVTFTAMVTPIAPAGGTPTGTVTFTVDGAADPACPAQPATAIAAPGVGAQATCTIGFGSAGAHAVGPTYSGDAVFAGSRAATAAADQVSPASTTTIVRSETAAAPVVGQTVTFVATVVPRLRAGEPRTGR